MALEAVAGGTIWRGSSFQGVNARGEDAMTMQARPPAGRPEPHGLASSRPMAGDIVKLSPADRDTLIRSVIATQALEGITVSYEDAARLLDEALRRPIPRIGE
jgi:hypothetical protein